MSYETVFNTIRSRFKTLIEDGESIPVHYDNAPFDKPDDSIWIRFTIVPGVTEQVEIPSTFRTFGLATAQVFTKIETGDKLALETADTVKSSFRAISVSGVTFRTPSLEVIGRSENWWQVNIECPFYSDETS